MSDTFGALTIPAASVDPSTSPLGPPPGDPALQKIGDYLQAVLNTYVSPAWIASTPNGIAARYPVVNKVLFHNPEQFAFNDNDLPALFIWRYIGASERLAEDWLMDNGTVLVRWIPPGDAQEIARTRLPICNAVAKTVESYLDLGRDPSWVDTGDTNPEAATIAASSNSFLLSKATSLSPQTYSGAGLDGARGTATQSPRLEVTITTTAAAGAYSTAAPIVVTWINWYGITVSASFFLTFTNGGETIGLGEDVKSLVSVVFPAQLSTAGTFNVGNATRVGRGSELLGVMGASRCELIGWSVNPLRIEQLDGEQRVLLRGTYYGLDMRLDVRDKRTLDQLGAGRAKAHTRTDFSVLNKDGTVTESASVPDNSHP